MTHNLEQRARGIEADEFTDPLRHLKQEVKQKR